VRSKTNGKSSSKDIETHFFHLIRFATCWERSSRLAEKQKSIRNCGVKKGIQNLLTNKPNIFAHSSCMSSANQKFNHYVTYNPVTQHASSKDYDFDLQIILPW